MSCRVVYDSRAVAAPLPAHGIAAVLGQQERAALADCTARLGKAYRTRENFGCYRTLTGTAVGICNAHREDFSIAHARSCGILSCRVVYDSRAVAAPLPAHGIAAVLGQQERAAFANCATRLG